MSEPDSLRVALAQMCSADTHAANIATVAALAAQAGGEGGCARGSSRRREGPLDAARERGAAVPSAAGVLPEKK